MVATLYKFPSLKTFTDGYGSITGASVLSFSCGLLEILATNLTGSGAYLQVFDGYAQPTVGAVPVLSMYLPRSTGDQGSPTIHWKGPLHGIQMSQGLYICSSSTASTYTAGGASDIFGTVLYWQ